MRWLASGTSHQSIIEKNIPLYSHLKKKFRQEFLRIIPIKLALSKIKNQFNK